MESLIAEFAQFPSVIAKFLEIKIFKIVNLSS